MYPIDAYVDQDYEAEQLVPDDEGALTTALMAASAHNDYVLYRTPSEQTRRLIIETISYLNRLLNKNDNRSRNSAICIMIHLTSVAMCCGDYDAAATHISGLYEVLRLYKAQQESYGVPRSTSQTRYEILKYKIERVAFSHFYITGDSVPFYAEQPSWDPLVDNTHEAFHTGSPKLDGVFYDFRALTDLVRHTDASQTKVEARYFRAAMHSMQARVIALPTGEGTPFTECVRLAVTAAFASQTQLPMRRLDHHHLIEQFRHWMPLLECPEIPHGEDYVLWILMAAFALAFHPHEEQGPWAERLFREAAGDAEDWETARQRVMCVTWLPRFIDDEDERIFNLLRRKWPLEGGEREGGRTGRSMKLEERMTRITI